MSDSSKAQALLARLKADAVAGGYLINPDDGFTITIAEGLLANEERYGYKACPCRLASGSIEEDRDMICPCDYRDADLSEYGACYCALYVTEEVSTGAKKLSSIPDRRLPGKDEKKTGNASGILNKELPYPVWRCKVCGYLCARDNPPGVCPICKAKADRFERFI
jgi:ferredoxin-thioredoxin reductase catalytic subunit